MSGPTVGFRLGWHGRGTAYASTFALLFLAGCAVEPPGVANGADRVIAPAGEHDERTCAVEGIVYDDEVRTLSGVPVRILGIDESTSTDAAGRFAFSHLAPGAYGIQASRTGFFSAVRDVECVQGEAVDDVSLQLFPIPDVTQAYKVIHQPVSGKIACAVGHMTSSGDLCQGTPLAAGDEYRTEFAVAADPVAITGAVFELQWTPSAGSGGKFLSLDYPQAQSQDAVAAAVDRRHDEGAGIVYGETPLVVRIDSGPSGEPVYLLQPGDALRLFVRPSSMDPDSIVADPTGEETSKLVFQQDFTVYAALFYNGEPIADGFTSRPA